ncbi:MAG: PorV/PorQ family protein, partial [Bacteroidota bacterium]
MRRSFVIAFTLLLVLPWGADALAQEGEAGVSKVATTAAPFLEIPVGARATGMGNAFVANANDVTCLFWNPSFMALLPQGDAVFSHSNWIGDMSFDYAAVAVPLGDFGAVGLSFTSLSMDDMEVRTVERPEGTGEQFSAGSFAIGIHYARDLSEWFAIGFTVKYIDERIWHMKATAFALDVGTVFTTNLFNGFRIGATITNFGTKMQLSGRDTRTFHR